MGSHCLLAALLMCFTLKLRPLRAHADNFCHSSHIVKYIYDGRYRGGEGGGVDEITEGPLNVVRGPVNLISLQGAVFTHIFCVFLCLCR